MMAEMKKLNKKRFDLHIVISLLCSNSGHMTTYMIFLCFPIRCFISGDPRWKNLVNDIDGCLKGIEEYSVRNSAELVTCLHHLCQRIWPTMVFILIVGAHQTFYLWLVFTMLSRWWTHRNSETKSYSPTGTPLHHTQCPFSGESTSISPRTSSWWIPCIGGEVGCSYEWCESGRISFFHRSSKSWCRTNWNRLQRCQKAHQCGQRP